MTTVLRGVFGTFQPRPGCVRPCLRRCMYMYISIVAWFARGVQASCCFVRSDVLCEPFFWPNPLPAHPSGLCPHFYHVFFHVVAGPRTPCGVPTSRFQSVAAVPAPSFPFIPVFLKPFPHISIKYPAHARRLCGRLASTLVVGAASASVLRLWLFAPRTVTHGALFDTVLVLNGEYLVAFLNSSCITARCRSR